MSFVYLITFVNFVNKCNSECDASKTFQKSWDKGKKTLGKLSNAQKNLFGI